MAVTDAEKELRKRAGQTHDEVVAVQGLMEITWQNACHCRGSQWSDIAMSIIDMPMSVPCFRGVANDRAILCLDDFLGQVNTNTPWPRSTENWETCNA